MSRKDDNEEKPNPPTAADRDKARVRTYRHSIWFAVCELRKRIHEAQGAGVDIGSCAEFDLEPLLTEIKRVREAK